MHVGLVYKVIRFLSKASRFLSTEFKFEYAKLTRYTENLKNSCSGVGITRQARIFGQILSIFLPNFGEIWLNSSRKFLAWWVTRTPLYSLTHQLRIFGQILSIFRNFLPGKIHLDPPWWWVICKIRSIFVPTS